MNFVALSRGFGTCCLRFKNGVTTIPPKLASGWLARLYREGVEPSVSARIRLHSAPDIDRPEPCLAPGAEDGWGVAHCLFCSSDLRSLYTSRYRK